MICGKTQVQPTREWRARDYCCCGHKCVASPAVGQPQKSCILEHVALLSFLDENGVPKTDLDPTFDETKQIDYRGGESYKFLIRHHSMLSQHYGWLRRVVVAAKNMGAERLLVRQHQIMYTQKLRPEYDYGG